MRQNTSHTPVVHGGNIIDTAKKIGCTVDNLIDMSSNLNPLGADDGLLAYLRDTIDQIAHLPESNSTTLRESFADKYNLSSKQVMAGSGTTEFIFSIPAAIPANRAIIITPTYADYFTACARADLTVETFTTDPHRLVDLKALAKILHGDELVFLCNPNNPTGSFLPTDDLLTLINNHPKTTFIIDESYIAFSNNPSLLDFPLANNSFVLCSYSKIFCIPGLRLGFLAGSAANIKTITMNSKPWGVNRLAQLAGEYLVREGERIKKSTLSYLEKERQRVMTAMEKFPSLDCQPGTTNFILCKIKEGMSAKQLYEKLLQQGIIIRDCQNFINLGQNYFRFSLKTTEQNDLFIKALGDILVNTQQTSYPKFP